MVHRIGAVPDDNPLNAALDLPTDSFGRPPPLLWSHVLAEDAVELLGFEIADIGKFRHRSIKFPGRECGNYRPGAIIEARGDRASRPEQLDARLPRIARKLLLRDLVVGFFSPGDLYRFDLRRGDADIIAAAELKHNMMRISGLAAGENNTGEHPPDSLYVDVAPDHRPEVLQG